MELLHGEVAGAGVLLGCPPPPSFVNSKQPGFEQNCVFPRRFGVKRRRYRAACNVRADEGPGSKAPGRKLAGRRVSVEFSGLQGLKWLRPTAPLIASCFAPR